MEQAQSHLKGWFILEFIKLVKKKKKLSFLFLRVVSEVIPKSTISEPIYTEKSISTGVKNITEGWMKKRVSGLLEAIWHLADHQIICKCNNLKLIFYKNTPPLQ